MIDSSSRPEGGYIHRLLDDAFSGVEMTPDVQDLKEEVRANLVARVAELETAGQSSADATRQSIDEFGDVRELVDVAVDGRSSARLSRAAARPGGRVRPKARFVVGAVVAAVVATGALVVSALGASAALPLPIGVTIALLALGASALGWIVGDSLAQETSTNHPMPQTRAGGYYLSSALTVFGLGFTVLVGFGVLPVWAVVFAAITIVTGLVLFAFLGATQTNRHKAWVFASRGDQLARGANRFEEEPETAARFGIYTMVIWVLAFAAFLVLTFTVGWEWSWLALLGGFVAMMLTLARMRFGPRAL
jgi:hypothetical protein